PGPARARGGQVALPARLPHQDAHRHLVEWRVAELERLGVPVEVGIEADALLVASLEPERVLVATGSEPEHRYPGALSTAAVLGGAEPPDGSLVVLDEEGHRKGAGVAEMLARDGRAVTLVGDGCAPAGQLVDSLAATTTLRRLRGS